MRDAPTNSDNVIDSRDVIARIETLRALRLPGPVDLGSDEDNGADQDDLFAELTALEALADEASGSSDWEYGETLVRDSYFKEYAQELAEDIGAIPRGLAWPAHCIDWDQAARELQMDYFSVDFGGVTYWIRG